MTESAVRTRPIDGGGQAARWLQVAREQLAEYFTATRWLFDVPLAPRGTAFQLSVWTALREIQPGSVLSYGEVARRIQAPRAVRAAGAANGQNPITIIIPPPPGDRVEWLTGWIWWRVGTEALVARP